MVADFIDCSSVICTCSQFECRRKAYDVVLFFAFSTSFYREMSVQFLTVADAQGTGWEGAWSLPELV
jgi:hypothetical protein